MSGPLAIALLAAGAATRFGGGKLDAPLEGKPLGLHALETAQALGRVWVIASEPLPAFADGAVRLNPHAAEGLGTSVALAARLALDDGAHALLLLAADMPRVSEATLRRLVEACAPGIPAATQQADGHPGIPACFPQDWFEALAGLGGDKGAGALLRASERVRAIAVPVGELADVDTAEDLARL